MNVSNLLKMIKMDLGIYGLALPFENVDDTLYDVIKIKTLPIYSTHLPYIISMGLNLKDLTLVRSSYQENVYELPDMGERKILFVKNVKPNNKLLSTGYMTPIYDAPVMTYDQLMMGQINADLMSYALPPFTFKFSQPNKLHLFNYSSLFGDIEVELAMEHSENLATIPNTAVQSFTELAMLDIKVFLYNTLKHYNDLQTAYANINLKIDDWSNAESERKDLLERWADVYHLELAEFMII